VLGSFLTPTYGSHGHAGADFEISR